MKNRFLFVFIAVCLCCTSMFGKEYVVKPTDSKIQYVGRISFKNPERPAFNYPGIQINAAFEGTQVKLMCRPGSGYFMAQIDEANPFKVAFRGARDSVVSLATALPFGRHTVRVMYCIEGYEFQPEFWGFITDGQLVSLPALSERRIEFVGNSITCGYGNEDTNPLSHFVYETENHYYSYAQLTARMLNATPHIVARSGIGAYRNYGGPKAGTPDNNMPAEYEYTAYAPESKLRRQAGYQSERWDFSRFTPAVVCINLGTNDLSTNNYDLKLLEQGYLKLISIVRQHNPNAKIVMLCGTMLNGKELEHAKRILNNVVSEVNKKGDNEVYRFDFTPQTGSLKYGADFHPSIWQHELMAAELTAYLRSLMQWF